MEPTILFETIKNKVKAYSYTQRIMRLIEIAVKEENADRLGGVILPSEIIEKEEIQRIRTENGEIDEVKKMRAITDLLDKQEQEKNG